MNQQVRVRFAPSPTGPLHIGGVRTALFNYLFAKKNKGVFFLRIEDTDRSRYVEEAENYLFKALKWLGIEPDETVNKNECFGPYRQSERKAIYKTYIEQLIKEGKAYYAFETSEELNQIRQEKEKEKQTFTYNHQSRKELKNALTLSKQTVDQYIEQGKPYAIRFKMPENKKIVVNDLIRGKVVFDSNLLDDKILYKSDGMPTYHFANIVDDYLMKTTHVIRGEEWLPSAALHQQLYEAFGWTVPEFAHVPLILKPVGNGKLSKRDGDKHGFPVFPLQWQTNEKTSIGYKEEGYLPQAVINFLALLGWNDGTDKEIYTKEELIKAFDLKKINKSGAKFDPEKNKWFNQQHLNLQTNQTLLDQFQQDLKNKGISIEDKKALKIIDNVKQRANFITDFYNLSEYLFVRPEQYNNKQLKKINQQTIDSIESLNKEIESIENFEAKNIENSIKNWITDNELALGKIMQGLRLALVGELKGIDVFLIMELINKKEVIKRINQLINYKKDKINN